MDEIKREALLIVVSMIVFAPLFYITILLSPHEAQALSIFSPFGGKVKSWLPEAPGCAEITGAVAVGTLGTVIITIEELKVGPPNGGTFGILRVDGATIPGITTIYKHKGSYVTPGTWVLGSAVDLCSMGGITGAAKTLCSKVSEGIAKGCPINNLVHKIGSGSVFGL